MLIVRAKTRRDLLRFLDVRKKQTLFLASLLILFWPLSFFIFSIVIKTLMSSVMVSR